MQLRFAEEKDSEAIRAIYNKEVRETVNTFDMTERTIEAQREWMEEHSGAYAAVVAEGDGVAESGESAGSGTNGAAEILGFGSLSPYRVRAGYTGTVEVSVYINADHRGQGVGHALLAYLEETAGKLGFKNLIARVTDGNAASHKLFAGAKYELVGVERKVGRKFNKWLDCTIYQKLIG